MFLRIKKKPSLKIKTAKKYYAKYETSPFEIFTSVNYIVFNFELMFHGVILVVCIK